MQDIERQARKKGIKLERRGRCQFCGSNVEGGVFECFEVFIETGGRLAEIGLPPFMYADAHCLQHTEVHGDWNNNLHLARQYLTLEREVVWNYSKTPLLSRVMDDYKLARPDSRIPALPVLERGNLTVTDLIGLEQQELERVLESWARGVYRSYERFHPIAKAIGDLYISKYEKESKEG
ncbi:hypothetical protein H7B90_21715 [Cohnella xylanilytica]|uniref:Uncharacterized protein n=1 Tax=Cohnella xylanilytica TaxID=557555 RepID=A0A841U3E3_9BACL|nr:DUF5946 family protein [Cohnella xylanilytica]MBB6694022.1 hypothetical protein [Cohnella xylanilytica]